jgi:hypothetical protein
MSDSIRQELGQIQGILSQIQKNTDKIPDLAATVQQHETTIPAIFACLQRRGWDSNHPRVIRILCSSRRRSMACVPS